MANIITLNISYKCDLPKNQALGMPLLLPYTLVSLVLDFSQMVLAVRKHLKMAKIIILNNSYYCNFSKKSIPGHVLVFALNLGVFGAGLQPEGPGCLETPSNSQYNHT